MKLIIPIIFLLFFSNLAISGEKDELHISAGAIVLENFRQGNNLKFDKDTNGVL